MKTIITYALLLSFLAFAACSKKSSSNNDKDEKFPNNIADTWSRTAVGSLGDTTTDNNTGQKWVKDIVILTSSEASKLEGLIQLVPNSLKDEFADKCKKYIDKAKSPEFLVRSDLAIRDTKEYKDFANFCIGNKSKVLSLAIGYLFNDADQLISSLGAAALSFCIEGEFEALNTEVIDESNAHQFTEDGKYRISYNSLSLQRRLAKKIIAGL